MGDYRLTVPTCFTIVRILFIPFIVSALRNNSLTVACVLFCISAITDVLDGYLARRYNQQTVLGALLDPLADKLLMIAVFITLSRYAGVSDTVPQWFVLLIVVKELASIIGAMILFGVRYRISIRPTILGKLAMAAQVLFVVWIFVTYSLGFAHTEVNQIMVCSVATIIMSAFVDYALRVYCALKNALRLSAGKKMYRR